MAEAVQGEAMQQPAGENERAVQREATRQPDGALKGDGMLRGCGATRSHGTTNQASGRQRRVERWQRWRRRWQNRGKGGLVNNQLKSAATVTETAIVVATAHVVTVEKVMAEAEADVGEN